ncbi:DUF3558 family protein, partial [Saccharomonospora azurea]
PADPAGSGRASSPGEAASLSGVGPCSLLTVQELGAFGDYAEGVERTVGTGRVCEWKEVRDSEGHSATLTLTLRENGGIADSLDQGYGERNGSMEGTGRPAKEVPTDVGCIVALGVGDGERAEVGASKLGSDLTPQDICDMVGEVAELIDPKLPLG